MPAVPQRSDAADRCSPGGRRNRWMGQLMSDAISYASTGRGFPVARVCAEVCLEGVSAAQRVSVSLCRCRLPRLGTLQKTPCTLPPFPFLPIAGTFSAFFPIADLPKHIA
jgi:hypothetical protein